MGTLSVFEYGRIESLTGAERNLLDQMRGPHDKRLFEVGWRETKATSFVGVVQLPTRTLQILPKMYRRVLDGRDGPPGRPSQVYDAVAPAVRPYPPDDKEREATANLLFLLSYTRKLDITEPEISRLTEKPAPLSEILFWIFAHRLWDAVHREILRGYVTIEDRFDVLKGRWLVATQAARPDGWRRDRFDVAYDEFTEDNLPNRLFKATVHRLSRWSQWTDTRLRGRSHFGAAKARRHLTQLRAVFADVADVTPQPHDFDQAAQWMLRHRRRANEGHLYRPLLRFTGVMFADTICT
jgi:5-methylcytosine-specific restriction endonuclease McrBC regulatory subunit McrC